MSQEEAEADRGQSETPPAVEVPAAAVATVADDATVDREYIAAQLGVSSVAGIAAIDDAVLAKIKGKMDEADALKSDKLVLQMNLEQLNHMSTKKLDVLKNKIGRLNGEKSALDESLQAAKAEARVQDGRIADLEIAHNSTAKRLQDAEEALATAEKEKNHAFELLKRRDGENRQLQQELGQLSSTNRELRGELVALETQNQRLASESLKLKFDKNNLGQELQILKKNSSWYEAELNKKMEELKHFKVDKYKEYSALQLELENTRNELQSSTSKYDHLKQNFDSTAKKLDDSLLTVKSLNDKIAYDKEDFLREMTSKDKLIQILNKSNEDRMARIQSLQTSLDSFRAENVKDSSELKVQLEKTKKQLQASTARVAQLEATIDNLTLHNGSTSAPAALHGDVSAVAGSIPSTPRAFKQFQDVTLSPSAQQTLSKIGGGVSLTQLYSDFQLMKKQLIKERRLKENLEKQVNHFVEELNRQVPAITATKERCSILEAELTDISILLEKTSKEKDQLLKENKNWSKKLNEYEMELSTLNKSRIDLSTQISHLVIQLTLKSEGDEPLTLQEREMVDRLVRKHAAENSNNYSDESDTDKLISDRLVKFNSVTELAAKNQELLKVTRQLGNQLESQDRLNQAKMDSLESIAIDEARDAIIVLQEQISSLEFKLSSISRERDMFRSIAGDRKQSANLQGNVFNSTPNSTTLDIKDSTTRAESELAQVSEDFKTYRSETESTIKILNKQINELSSAKSELAIQLARVTSSAQLYEERYKSIQETLKYSKSEAEEIRKRSNILQDNLSKHDVVNQQLTEELIQTKSMIESLHLEITNLKAEKQLWKSIEKRLNEENSSLIDERLRLNSLTSDLQRLENERNKGFTESTARLNNTIASLESELTLLKSKLEVNNDELRSALLRKDADAKAYQDRIESLRSELSLAKEDLIKRKSASQQMEATVRDLQKQLSSAEDQLKSYESTEDAENEEDVEKRLRQQLHKAKSELDAALNELNTASENVQQFQSVANAAEQRLAELSNAYDEFKDSANKKITESDERIKELLQQITEANENISSFQTQLGNLQKEKDSMAEGYEKEVASLKVKASSTDEIVQQYEDKIALVKRDLDEQSKIANDCQMNYEAELQKHAEVSKLNTKLREDESSLKIKIQELTVEARDAKSALSLSQESWENQKLSLEEELKAAQGRVSELNLQNRMILNQLEQLTKQQKDAIHSSATPLAEGLDFEQLDGSSEELLQVVSFLRHEKEISDAQLDIATQEQKRLQQNLDITKQELEDVKGELVKLQNKEAHSEQLEKNYKDLTDKINQLDILRESNNTLRQECQAYSNQIKSLESQLATNVQKLEPLEFQVASLQAELETKNKELDSERNIVEFWKNKNQELLQNYNRIDPDEYNGLKKRVEELTASNAQVEELQKKIVEVETTHQNERKKSIREANDRLTKFKGIIDVTKKELTDEKAKTTELQGEIEKLQKQIAETSTSSDGANEDSSKALEESARALEELKQTLQRATEDGEKRVAEISTSRDQLAQQLQELQTKSSVTPSVDVEALNAAFTKEKEEIISQKNKELEQMKFKLKIEVKKELQESGEASAGAVDVEALKKQWESEHEKEVNDKIKEACDALKAKIREPHEAKINAIVSKRFEKLKHEAELELKKKEEELVKKYSGGSGGAATAADGAEHQKLQEEIKKLKASIDAECKKAKEEGRSSALKESEMRFKMTKRQLDRAKEELAKYQASGPAPAAGGSKLPQQPLVSSIPAKPAVGNATGNNGSRIPTHSFRDNLKKPEILKPSVGDPAPVQAAKRPAEDSGEATPDKKPKSE